MKNGIDNFIKLLVEGDFFLIFLIVIMIVIVSVIIYLIKLQVNEKLYNELDEDDDNIEKYIAIGIVAVIGVVGCVLIIKKEK